MDAVQHTYASLATTIAQIVADRRTLSANGASAELLEENHRRLAEAQTELSHLLVTHDGLSKVLA